jgi:hypothetical protein
MPEDFQLEKYVWTDEDLKLGYFDDARIYGMQSGPKPDDISFDIDCTFLGIGPPLTNRGFRFWKPRYENEGRRDFWVSPCTLVFHRARNFKSDFAESPDAGVPYDEDGSFDILDVERFRPDSGGPERLFQAEVRLSKLQLSFGPKTRQDPYESGVAEWVYNVNCAVHRITLRASGFTLYVRAAPLLLKGQYCLGLETRGGVSFECISPQM